jgi:hypothetical protein
MPKKKDAEFAGLHALGQILQMGQWDAGLLFDAIVECDPFHQSTQCPEALEILTWFHL